MLTRNELIRIAHELRDRKVLSVYLDGTAPDPAERSRWRRELDERIVAARGDVAGATHEEREAFERCVTRLREALPRGDAALRTPGWVGLIPAEGNAYVEGTSVRMPTLVAWDSGPRIAPYIRSLKQRWPALVVVADARHATLYIYAMGVLEMVEVMHAASLATDGQHMGYPPRVGFHTGTRGTAAADQNDRLRRAATEGLIGEVTHRIDALAGQHSWIFVGGIPDVASALVRALPPRLESRAYRVTNLDVHATEAQIQDVAEREARAASRERDLVRVLDLIDHEASDRLGVSGVEGVRGALEQQGVATLFFTRAFVEREPALAEGLVRAAFEQGAEVEHVSGVAGERLDQTGGVGARLRFRPEPVASATAPMAGAAGG